MCFKCLKDRRAVAYWLSGFFGAAAIKGLTVAILDLQVIVPKLGYGVAAVEGVFWFFIAGAISLALCYFGCKEEKKVKRAKK